MPDGIIPDRSRGGNPARRATARDWAERSQAREDEITARRLATRARNTASRPPRRVIVPKSVKPAAFYQSVALDLDRYPEHLRWPILYFLNLIRWRTITWRANAEGFAQLLYTYLER